MIKPYKIPNSSPTFVLNGTDLKDLDKQIKKLEKEFLVREVDLVFRQERFNFKKVTNSRDVADFLREIIGDGIEVQEHFVVLYLNHANNIIGYYKHAKGGINSTVADIEIIAAVAVKVLAKAVIISHNHPSGNTKPSDPDIALTKKMKQALGLFDIHMLDHIIITYSGYYSFADEGNNALSGITENNSKMEQELRLEILKQLRKVTKANSPNIWQEIQTQSGYRRMEEKIIREMMHKQLIPAAIIPQIESELEMN